MLSVRGLAKSFGANKAVDNLSFDLLEGEMLALIGPNGAGKSTTFNMVNGQLKPDKGTIVVDDQSLVGKSAKKIWRLGISRTFQIAEIFQTFTLAENVQLALLSSDSKLFSFWSRANQYRREDAVLLLKMVGLGDQSDKACSTLAYSDAKRLELAVALANQPKILLMDEPTAGMAPGERKNLMALVRDLVQERKRLHKTLLSVLFTEHSMDVVFGYADRIIVMARGELIVQGSAEVVKASSRVQDVYFGGGKTFK
jgi:branched-chain amino acid transport system ATP-binding protein